jgi:hypothetical protein
MMFYRLAIRAAANGLMPLAVTCFVRWPGIMDDRRCNPKSRRAATYFAIAASLLLATSSKPCGRSFAHRR